MHSFFEYLLNNTDTLYNHFDKEYLYNLGRILPYKERITFDYRMYCYEKNIKFSETISIYKNEDNFIDKLISNNELTYILDNLKSIKLKPALLNYFNSIKESLDEKQLYNIEMYIVRNLSEFYPQVTQKDLENFRKTLLLYIDNLLDIKQVDYGGYAKIYRANDKIIKVACTRICKEIPDNPYLLIPYFKGKIGNDYVEITDYLDPNVIIKNTDAFDIYKNLRDMGIIWLDPTTCNLSRISKEVLKNNIKKRLDGNLPGIIKNPDSDINTLEENDIVIIDLDHIFYEHEIDKMNAARNDFSEYLLGILDLYEKKYQDYKKKM